MSNSRFKFRAWDSFERIMIKDWGETGSWMLNEIFEKSEYQIMQYTGLKDKNGVEIYEGDLVLVGLNPTPAVIEFKDACYWAVWESDEDLLHDLTIKVIGNIYEHKDLL